MTRGVGVTLGAEERTFHGGIGGSVREWEEGREKGLNLAMRFLAEPRNDVGEEWEGEGERAVREQAPTRWLSDGWEGWVPAPPSSRGQDLDARTTGGGAGGSRTKPLPDGCQTGGRDGSPPPRLHGGRISTRGQRGGGVRVGGWG